MMLSLEMPSRFIDVVIKGIKVTGVIRGCRGEISVETVDDP